MMLVNQLDGVFVKVLFNFFVRQIVEDASRCLDSPAAGEDPKKASRKNSNREAPIEILLEFQIKNLHWVQLAFVDCELNSQFQSASLRATCLSSVIIRNSDFRCSNTNFRKFQIESFKSKVSIYVRTSLLQNTLFENFFSLLELSLYSRHSLFA